MGAQQGKTWAVDDLGVVACGDANYDHISGVLARHPVTGEEYVIHTTFARGFIAISPRTQQSVHILPESDGETSRSATQGPDGLIYQVAGKGLVAWNWQDACSHSVVDFPPGISGASEVDFDHKGCAYLWGTHHQKHPS